MQRTRLDIRLTDTTKAFCSSRNVSDMDLHGRVEVYMGPVREGTLPRSSETRHDPRRALTLYVEPGDRPVRRYDRARLQAAPRPCLQKSKTPPQNRTDINTFSPRDAASM